MKRAFKWLDRRIAHPGPYLALVLDQAEFDSVLRSLKVPGDFPYVSTPQADATTHHLTTGNGGWTVVVGLRDTATRTPIEVAGLLVHEAVHVWQEYCARLGEHTPGREQEAYAVQAIAQELMAEYARRINKG